MKALLFDLDGTLLDSLPVIFSANKAAFAEMDIAYDEAFVRSLVGMPLETQAEIIAPGRAKDFVRTYKRVYRAYRHLDSRLYPGTVQMLDAVRSRGFLTALVTSKADRPTRRIVAESGMNGRFDAVITADDVDHPKPHPEPFAKSAEVLGVAPAQSLAVGDSVYDADSARAAGIGLVGVSWGAAPPDDLTSAGALSVFDSWEQFLRWLSG